MRSDQIAASDHLAEAAIRHVATWADVRSSLLSPSADIAAIYTVEDVDEFETSPLPAYAIVLGIRLPEPVVKIGHGSKPDRSARTGEFGITNPGRAERWAIGSGKKTTYETTKLFLPKHVVGEKAEAAFGSEASSAELFDVHGVRDPLVSSMLQGISLELDVGDGGSLLFLESAAQTVTLHLLRHYSTLTKPEDQRQADLTPRYVQRAQDFIEAHLGEDVSLSAIAAAANLSPHHFLRAFKAATGRTPHRYVQERRVELCRRLLETTELPLADIAYQCGFASQSHMTTVFRGTVGTTPGRYRSEAQAATPGVSA
ncbi:MAG: helix-turn-helix domain-containing protein [Geminicoccaceae bacterium]